MAKHICPQCGSGKATIVMLPGAAGSSPARLDPTYRCLECDRQWNVRDALALAREAPTAGDGIDDGPAAGPDST